MIDGIKFLSETTLFLRNSLNSNITDPKSRNKRFVFTSFPKKNVDYPLVTIRGENLKWRSAGIDVSSIWISFSLEIRIWADNEKHKDNVTQDVINHLKTLKNGPAGLTENGIYSFTLRSAVPVDDPKTNINSWLLKFDCEIYIE